MNLNTLRAAKGSHKKRFKKGRGPGSGIGKTCGKGQKGAGARKSPGRGVAFEGGQMPLQRRLPKIGFNPPNRMEYQVVNLGLLEKRASGEAITGAELEKWGLVRYAGRPIKILATGKITKALHIKASKFSAAARSAIEAAGGKAEEV